MAQNKNNKQNNNIITLFIFRDGEYAYWSHITAKMAYKIIDDFSVRIGNSHLQTPRRDVIESIKLGQLVVNLSPNGKRFAITVREDETDVEEFIKDINRH